MRRVMLVGAFSMPAVAAGIGLILAPTLMGLLAFACLSGVLVSAIRADDARQRARALADAEGATPAVARAHLRTARWSLLGIALFVAPAVVSSQWG